VDIHFGLRRSVFILRMEKDFTAYGYKGNYHDSLGVLLREGIE
jgi:hypothetical protein